MIYELRIYVAAPGKIRALHDRFAKHTLGFFEKHGMKSIGYWTEDVGEINRIVYILAFNDLGDMERKWAAFRADPGWQKVVAESERDGPLVARVINRVLRPTAYSPLK